MALNSKKGFAQAELLFSLLIAGLIVFSVFSFVKYTAVQEEEANSQREIQAEIISILSEAYSVDEISSLDGQERKVGDYTISVSYSNLGDNGKYGVSESNLKFTVEGREKDKETYEYVIERSGYYEKN